MSISSHDWLANSSADPAVFARWPDYEVTLIAVDQLDQAQLAPVAAALFEQAVTSARTAGTQEPDQHALKWQHAYRDFGVKPRDARPSVDALLRRAGSAKGLPRINALVDLYNAASMLHGVPIGGEDLDHYDGPARLIVASGEEPFHTSAFGEPIVEHPAPGEPVWMDGGGVTCRRWNWRQTSRTAITDGTTRVGFIIDSLASPDHAGAAAAAAQLQAVLPGALVRVIRAEDE
jgi:DNA/RNA-binding domain of Phe-tRNA-synthetase-like protein